MPGKQVTSLRHVTKVIEGVSGEFRDVSAGFVRRKYRFDFKSDVHAE